MMFWRVGVLAAALLTPALAFAATAAVAGLAPGNAVGVDTPVVFSIVSSGFVNPTYSEVDSFGGGVNNRNIDSAGNFRWTPNRDDIGSHTITVTVADSAGAVATAQVQITVTAPSVSVVGLSPGAAVTFGNQLSFSLTSVGFLTATYSVLDSFARSSITSTNLSGDKFYWTPLLQDVGVHQLSIVALDIPGHRASTTQTIVVDGIPTVQVVGPASVGVGSVLSFNILATSFTQPSYAVTDLFYPVATSSTLKLSGTQATWTPVYNDLGGHTFVVTVTDSAGHTVITRYSVSVVQAQTQTQTSAAPQPVATSTAPVKTAGTSAYVFKTFLTVGSSGAEVTALQQKLVALKLYSGPATGYFGPLTAAAVKNFQKSVGLEQVGYLGPGTRAALNK